MSKLSTHVLDTNRGRPAEGISIVLRDCVGEEIGNGVTNADGRVGAIGPEQMTAGDYVLTFATAPYFAALGQPSFYPEVVIAFTIADPTQHYHVPVLLSPYGFTTYRGS